METIFYSWQSDLPSKTNRGYISDCLSSTLSPLKDEGIDYEIDEATRNSSGSPNIVESVLSKIQKSSIFVGDVSLSFQNAKGKKSPNPNVLIELGFALNNLGWDRIILVFNEHFGKIEDLPFDINQRRVSKYCYDPEHNGASHGINFFEDAIKTIFEQDPAKGYFDDVKNKADFELIREINSIFDDNRLDSFFSGFPNHAWREDLRMFETFTYKVNE